MIFQVSRGTLIFPGFPGFPGRVGTLLADKSSAGVTPEVNLREVATHMPQSSTSKAAHSGFETLRRHH